MSKKMTLAEYISTRRYVVVGILKFKEGESAGRMERHIVKRSNTSEIEETGLLEVAGEVIWTDDGPHVDTPRDTWVSGAFEADGYKGEVTASTDLDLYIEEGEICSVEIPRLGSMLAKA